jgi:glucokinase
MAQVARTMLLKAQQKNEASSLLALESPVTARDVGQAALAGDRVARRILEASGRRLGQALAVLVDLFNPERIVMGGLGMRLGELLVGPARKVLTREALSASVAACRIVPAELDEQIGDIAALSVVPGAELAPSEPI